jgi:hypothetical protein
VHALLRHCERQGFQGAPRYLGRDAQGREILSYLPGSVPAELGSFSRTQRRAAARLLRAFHDVTACSELRGTSAVVCHGDPSPCNCVFVDGVPRAFIDFDAAHPGSRGDDLGYAAWLWLDIGNAAYAPTEQGAELADFVAAYDPGLLADALNCVMGAQRDLSLRTDDPQATRDWAAACLRWTQQHAAAMRTGMQVPRDSHR